MKTPLLTVCFAALAACVSPLDPLPPTGDTPVRFDPNEVAYFHETGPASIEGQAVMHRQTGALETCRTVVLHPAGAFGEQYMQEMWGSTESANRNVNAFFPVLYTPDMDAYVEVRRAVTCDAGGRFRFDGLADGDYFVTTGIEWFEDNNFFGAHLMQRVRIRDGQNQTVRMPN